MLSIEEIKKAASSVCKKYDVERAYLFGSYSRGEADENSDVDIRIEKSKNSRTLSSILKVCFLECDLEDILQKKVQVITQLPAPDDELNAAFFPSCLLSFCRCEPTTARKAAKMLRRTSKAGGEKFP